MYKKITLLLFAFLGFYSANSWAWNAEKTHKDLSEKAAEYSVLSLTGGDYLKNFGFSKNIEEPLSLNGESKSVKEWIGEGGIKEDAGNIFTAYYYHHFHNPIATSWNQAGLSTYYPWINGMSSLLWAQNTTNPWNWQEARDYYYLALTSTTDTERQANFAKTFQGLGHIIHLIEDAAQPAHVRDDAHPLDDIGIIPQFENWAKDNRTTASSFMSNPIFPAVSFNSSAEAGYIPITQLWDTNQYNGSNPPSGIAIGLSEYTNANFFSEDTINASNFPYPDITQTTITERTPYPNAPYQRQYYLKNCCGETNGGQGYLLSAVDYLDYYRNWIGSTLPKIPVLDDNVYQDYGSLLLPRVGYSAGLLNYFFRGQMEATPSSGGLKVKNTNTETMEPYTDSTGQTIGSITIYYDNINSERYLLAAYVLSAPLDPGEETPVISFAPPSDNIKQGRYIVVFYGKLGNEEGAVIGRVTSPSKIYYVSKRDGIYKIYRIEADGSNPAIIYDNPNPNLGIGKLAPSPDGNTLAFTVDGPRIYLLDITTGNLQELTTGQWPSWSPDGTKTAFHRESGQYSPYADVEIFTIDPLTSIETQLTNVPGSSYSGLPAWSPDGQKIAYTKFNSPQEANCVNLYTIYLMDSSGNPIGSLTCDSGMDYMDFAPSWSPDGKEITFTRRRVNQFNQLYKVNIDTKAITKLTDSTGATYDELTPSWSPDGNSIAIGSKRDGDFDIWLVDPNGGGYKTNITDSNPDIDGYPACGR